MMAVGLYAGARLAAVPELADDGTTTIYRLQVGGAGGGSGGGGDASAANQTTEIARLTSIRDATGAAADTAATSDVGTFSLIALFKRSLGYLSTLATAALKPTSGTNLSGTATTTSGGFNLAADSNRKPGDVQGQNVSGVSIGFNEFGGAAAIGSAGTYTVAAGQSFSITTNQLVNFVAASGTAAVTITKVV